MQLQPAATPSGAPARSRVRSETMPDQPAEARRPPPSRARTRRYNRWTCLVRCCAACSHVSPSRPCGGAPARRRVVRADRGPARQGHGRATSRCRAPGSTTAGTSTPRGRRSSFKLRRPGADQQHRAHRLELPARAAPACGCSTTRTASSATAGGYRWQDRHGNSIDYDAEGTHPRLCRPQRA